jgi:hypothetical protein
MMRSLSLVVGVLSGLLTLSAPAVGDKVHLTGGGVLEGAVERVPDGYQVRLASGAVVVVPHGDVIRIEEAITPHEELAARRSALAPTDVQGYYALGLWCLDRGLPAEAESCFRHVVRVEQDHAAAREALGDVRFGDEWISWEEALRRRGQVKHEGRWVTVEERDRLVLEARKRSIEREIERLAARLRSGLPDTRRAAAEALRDLGKGADPAALTPLLAAGRHWNAAVREAAAAALGSYAAKEARALDLLLDLATRDATIEVQDAAIAALVPLRLVPAGERLLDDYLFAPEASVRAAAAHALGQLRYKAAVAPLIETLYFVVVKNRLIPVGYQPIQRRLISHRSFPGYYLYERIGGQSPFGGVGLRRYEVRPGLDYLFNGHAKESLKAITGRDLDYDRDAWRAYWREARERHGPFMEPVDPPIAAPAAPGK